jgi:hypothetical protein
LTGFPHSSADRHSTVVDQVADLRAGERHVACGDENVETISRGLGGHNQDVPPHHQFPSVFSDAASDSPRLRGPP